MPDAIAPEERRLIDDAVKRGKITRCEEGASGINSDAVWSEKLGRLIYADPEYAKAVLSSNWERRGRKPDPKVTARRQRVKAFVEKGMTCKEIMAVTGSAESIVRNDASRVGVKFAPVNSIRGARK